MPAADQTVVDHIRTVKFRRRFYGKLMDNDNGCHVWTGAVSSNGRGMVGVMNRTYSVHRVAWMMQSGQPIAAGMTVDHLCYNGLCVNPDHLQLVDLSENVRRAIVHFGNGASLRIRESRSGKPAYQVLWVERTEGRKKQRGRTFSSREDAEAFMAQIRGTYAA